MLLINQHLHFEDYYDDSLETALLFLSFKDKSLSGFFYCWLIPPAVYLLIFDGYFEIIGWTDFLLLAVLTLMLSSHRSSSIVVSSCRLLVSMSFSISCKKWIKESLRFWALNVLTWKGPDMGKLGNLLFCWIISEHWVAKFWSTYSRASSSIIPSEGCIWLMKRAAGKGF